MTLPLIFAGLIFTAFAIYMAVTPLLQSSVKRWRFEYLDSELREIEFLVARRVMLLNALRELEFEKETAKVSESDYTTFRKKFEREAVRIMKRIDNIHGGRGWESKIDALIAKKNPSVAKKIAALESVRASEEEE